MSNFQDSLLYILNITNDPIVLHEINGFPGASLEVYGSFVYSKTMWQQSQSLWDFCGYCNHFLLRKKPLHPIITDCEILYWTGGSVCSFWIKNKKGIKNVVQYWVDGVRWNSLMDDWHFCKTVDNPANFVTRQLKLVV